MVLVMKEKLRGLPGLLVLLVRALRSARQPCLLPWAAARKMA